MTLSIKRLRHLFELRHGTVCTLDNEQIRTWTISKRGTALLDAMRRAPPTAPPNWYFIQLAVDGFSVRDGELYHRGSRINRRNFQWNWQRLRTSDVIFLLERGRW